MASAFTPRRSSFPDPRTGSESTRWMSSRFTPYVQALFGGAHVSTSLLDPNTGNSFTQNGFAAAFGGGLDFRLTDHIAVKPFQLEYMMTQLPNVWSPTNTQNNLRYSAGIVFRFGSK